MFVISQNDQSFHRRKNFDSSEQSNFTSHISSSGYNTTYKEKLSLLWHRKTKQFRFSETFGKVSVSDFHIHRILSILNKLWRKGPKRNNIVKNWK